MRIWVMSKHYRCPEHEWDWPVCIAYGDGPYCPGRHLEIVDGWALVRIDSSPQHIAAMELDSRVVYCGKRDDEPPEELLRYFAPLLDSKKTYDTMGKVIAHLAKKEPAYYHEDDYNRMP